MTQLRYANLWEMRFKAATGKCSGEVQREGEGGSVSLNLALTLCDSWKFGIVMVLWSTHTLMCIQICEYSFSHSYLDTLHE